MRKLLVTLVATLAVFVSAPAMADEFAPTTPVATPAGYTGPAVYGLWPTTGTLTTIPVYAPVDRRWGVRRVLKTLNTASGVQLVLTSIPCEVGCITIRQTTDPATFAVYDGPNGRGIDSVGGFAGYDQADGVMRQCDIVMNRTLFYTDYPPAQWIGVAHEIEHCLGLSHTDQRGTVVGAITDGMTGPSSLDLKWLGQLYGVGPSW